MTENKIPYGYCHCGCGQKTTIAKRNNKSMGMVKGEPRRFVQGHYQKQFVVPLSERFWSRVNKLTADECWEWTGHRFKKGYGALTIAKIPNLAHRISWQIHFGEIPNGLQVCHKCDNPPCVNPNHLFLGTRSENMQDCVTKGRLNSTKGEKKRNAKLTESDIIEIRKLHNQGQTKAAIGRLYSVDQATIGCIVRYKSWRHVP